MNTTQSSRTPIHAGCGRGVGLISRQAIATWRPSQPMRVKERDATTPEGEGEVSDPVDYTIALTNTGLNDYVHDKRGGIVIDATTLSR